MRPGEGFFLGATKEAASDLLPRELSAGGARIVGELTQEWGQGAKGEAYPECCSPHRHGPTAWPLATAPLPGPGPQRTCPRQCLLLEHSGTGPAWGGRSGRQRSPGFKDGPSAPWDITHLQMNLTTGH